MSKVLQMEKYAPSKHQTDFAVLIIWLFHISAIIGVSLGFFNFFIPKTALNLLVSFFLLCWVFPIDTLQKVAATSLFFFVGMFVEYLGVNYGLLFGDYSYGQNLGIKFQGVPYLIGVNWAMLVLITGPITNRLKVAKPLKAIIGATLMILLDIPMEVAAPIFDFWEFAGGVAPLQNYIAWWLIAVVLHAVFQGMNLLGNYRFALHLYLCQLLFFIYFYGFYSL
ncbi:MAG: carotenoid biosynthesis protein [Bacteroidota bacterium]